MQMPEDISCGDQIFDISFHPQANVLAAGLIDGSVEIWNYSYDGDGGGAGGDGEPGNNLWLKNSIHTSSVRGVEFNDTGDTLYTVSSDRSLQAVDATGKQILHFPAAHDHPINKMTVVDHNKLATGDDKGVVKLWDMRVGDREVMNWRWVLCGRYMSTS
jgi:WD40 repeat protein